MIKPKDLKELTEATTTYLHYAIQDGMLPPETAVKLLAMLLALPKEEAEEQPPSVNQPLGALVTLPSYNRQTIDI
jgi:hypothetical protein